MYSNFWPIGGCQGILHHYTETLTAFEFTSDVEHNKPHSLLFVGGLGYGLATTSYLDSLAEALALTPWSLFTLNLTSSYNSWGLGGISNDIQEIAQCINYINDYKSCKYGSEGSNRRRVVLMGHSTGSQDVLHYLYRPNPIDGSFTDGESVERPAIDGAIMQAPVSDREAFQLVLRDGFGERKPAHIRPLYDQAQTLALEAAAEGLDLQTLLPLSITSNICYSVDTPISCRRWLSLTSPHSPEKPSEDDVFSSDLSDDQLSKTFEILGQNGLLKGKLLVLVSGADQSVPEWVDKEQLVRRWKRAVESGERDGEDTSLWDHSNSGVIPNASHALSDDDQEGPREELARWVLNFLEATLQRD